MDDAAVEGILNTTGYIDFRKTYVEEVVGSLVSKVVEYNREHGIQFEIVKLEEVFRTSDLGPKGKPLPQDSDFRITCPTCSYSQLASEAPLSLDGSDTLYSCKNGCQPVIVISRPGIVAWPGRGFRTGRFVIRNASDLFVQTEEMESSVLFPASKSALMKRRPPAE